MTILNARATRRSNIRKILLASATALLSAGPALAREAAPATQDTAVEEIVVRGIRKSLANAVAVKRDAAQIVDAISAEDIGKLPDQNIAESLQRVTGVQISRSNGQGSGVAIRGLTQIRFELDGATLTGNGTGRAVSFESIPSELFGQLQVYKSPSAETVEGGLGGTINLVTRKPLDLEPMTVSGSVQGGYADFRDEKYPRLSGLISSKWNTDIGRIGALLNVSYEERKLRSDEFDVLAWDRVGLGDINGDGVTQTATSGPLTPDEVWRPRQLRSVSQAQDRKRLGAVGTLQWAPSSTLQFTWTNSYNRFKYRNDYRLLRLDVDKARANTTDFKRNENGTLISATVNSGGVLTNNFVEPTNQTNYTSQLDMKWDLSDRLQVTAKGNIARGRNRVPLVVYPTLVGNAPTTIHYDFASGADLPSISLPSFNLNDLANYKVNTVVPQSRHTANNEDALRFDVRYDFDLGVLESVKAGGRYGKRTLAQQNDDSLSNKFTNTPVATMQAQMAGAFTGTLTTGDDFLSGLDGALPRSWAGYASSYVNGEGLDQLMSAWGLSVPIAQNITTYYDVREKTWAGYVQANLSGDIASKPWSGNVGVRVVETDSHSFAFLPDSTGALTWQDSPNKYTDVLPSANFKVNLTDDLVLRLAAAKVIARAAADQLKAATSINYGFQTASSGNPTLDPFRATQYDASLEWYFRPSDLLSVAVFKKDVSAFIANEIVNITIVNKEFPGHDDFRLSRPRNGNSGEVQGFELGLQHSFAELPAPFDGLGVQANYTFIDSTTPNTDPFTGDTLPLEGLSKNSYNLVGFYEKYGFSARLAYNWRSKFLTGTVAGSPVFSKAVGQLDASASYDINDRLTMTFEAINLNGVEGYTYQTVKERLLSHVKNDRLFSAGLRFRY